MNFSIEHTVKRLLRSAEVSSTIQKELGLDPQRATSAADSALTLIIATFREQTESDDSNNNLYEVICKANSTLDQRLLKDRQRDAAIEDATGQLQQIVGPGEYRRLSAQISIDEALTESQSKKTLAYASAGVVTQLQSQLEADATHQGAAGVAALLAAPAVLEEQVSTGHEAVYEDDNKKRMLYFLPLLMLGLTLIGLLRHCSEPPRMQASTNVQTEPRQTFVEQPSVSTAIIERPAILAQVEDSGQGAESNNAEDGALAELRAQTDKVIDERNELGRELSTTLVALFAEKDARQKEVEQLTAQIDSLEKNLGEAIASNTELGMEIELLNADKQRLAASLRDAAQSAGNEDSAGLTTQLNAAIEQNAVLAADLSMQKKRVSRQVTQIRKLQDDIAQLVAEKERFADSPVLTDNDPYDSKLEILGNEIAKLTAERDQLKSSLEQRRKIDTAPPVEYSLGKSADSSDIISMRDNIQQKLDDAGLKAVTVSTTDNNTAVAISIESDSNLYLKRSVTLSRSGSNVLNQISKIIADYPQWNIDVEGHTDATPIGPVLSDVYPTNWELSSARASAVVNYLNLFNDVKPGAMSARGYADTRPIASNATPQGQQRNRRVDVVLRRP